jgi:hypothetical protein
VTARCSPDEYRVAKGEAVAGKRFSYERAKMRSSTAAKKVFPRVI